MFGARKASKNVSATDTFIGEGTVVEGKIVTSASLRIEGTVVGDIECQGDVFIGEKAQVRSIIAARSVFAAGKIEGSVLTKGKLTITSKGRVDGDIVVGSLHVSEGGVLRGQCAMEQPRGGELRPAKEKPQKEKDAAKQASA
ncbi:polymer-forming cytoskeletal protein [Paenibacillus sp.]|uniref:bactofilin family protein n=1 Tax=Paenibacillus sp. TaxID=58172 RepID=UPI002D58BCB1|nr:polymer-forming cytoskeletal protein [Paenibacillus sp.]HZG85013.1 polymer-forming cytoskeletal protein [Paenibacillus sp.]